VYAREIDAQYDCRECEASAHEWTQRGRCTGALPEGGVVQLRVDLDGQSTSHAYPQEFASCPKGLLRSDKSGDAVAVATMVSHAANAEMDKRYPDVPNRMLALLHEWRQAEAGRMRAEQDARMEVVRRR